MRERGWVLVVLLGIAACGADASSGASDADVIADTDDTLVADATVDDTLDASDDAPDASGDTHVDAVDSGADSDARVDVDAVVPASPVMRLHALDVGQGDAFIVELPCGAMLVDTGGEVTDDAAPGMSFDSSVALAAAVRAFFAGRPDLHATFDLVVLSHPHIDHTRGVTQLLAMVAAGELSIKNVVTNGAEGSGSGLREQRALHDFADADDAIGRWYVLQRKTGASGFSNAIVDPFPACSQGGASVDPIVTALWGRVDDGSAVWSVWSDDELANANNDSVVLRVDFGASSLLMTGDLEEAGIAALVAQYAGTGLLDVDVYKVGHHGSHNGTTAALVNAMSPRAAVISAGPAARHGDWTAYDYGHPRWPAVSDLLGDGDSDGVSMLRPTAIDALVATSYAQGHGIFESRHIAPAVYTTGWEGHAVVITLHADGAIALPD